MQFASMCFDNNIKWSAISIHIWRDINIKYFFLKLDLQPSFVFCFSCCCLSVPLSLSDRLMMNSQAKLITAAVWLLAVHLLRPLNCNPSKKRCLALSHPRPPSAPLPSTVLFNSPQAHEIKFAHSSELCPCWFFLCGTNYVCLSENNLNPITFCTCDWLHTHKKEDIVNG